MNKPIPPELVSELERLEDDDVARVVAYAKSLGSEDKLAARNVKLRTLIGSIPKDEIEQMRVAIEEGCEPQRCIDRLFPRICGRKSRPVIQA